MNANLVRNHIIYHRMQLEETPTLFGFPEAYYREVPPEMEPGYVARAIEIRAAAKASLEAYRADPDYHFILSHQDNIPEKMRGKLSVDIVLGYVTGLEGAIAEDDLVAQRRHRNADPYHSDFISCAQRMREFMSGSMETADDSALDEPDDEDCDEELDEVDGDDFDEDEQEFGGMTMKM